MEIVFLYNGAVMDETGDCVTMWAPLFYSVLDAEKWLADHEYDNIMVVKGKRVGDRIVNAEVL